MPDDALQRPQPRAFRRNPPTVIGGFAVHAASNELAGPRGTVRLRPRLMDVLLRLAASPGEVVTRQALIDDVWPRRLVADEVLSRAIAELRTALADDARDARFIETLPKVGYRLIARVEAAPPPASIPEPATAPAAGHAVAVLDPAAGGSARRAAPRRPRWRIASLAVIVLTALIVGGRQLLRQPAPLDGSGAAPLAEQLNGAIAFSSDVDLELSPRFSRDGTKVAFVVGDYNHGTIVIQDVATRTRTTFGAPDTAYLSPVWLPDGVRIAYFLRQGDRCGIVLRDLRDDSEHELVGCAQSPGARFDIAPDGGRLVFAGFAAGDAGLRIVDLATGRITQLTRPQKAAGIDAFPRFSPDGKRVAFSRGLHGQSEVWTVPLGAPDEARATGSPRSLMLGLAWVHNDGPLLVAADWFGFRALNLLDVATGKSTLVGARNAQFPDVGPHGEIIYESAMYQANLQLVDLAAPGVAPRTLWPSVRYTNYPQFAPDGRRIVFLSNRDNTASLFVGTLGGDMRRVPLPADHIFVQPHWSHDGRALYAVRAKAGEASGPSQAVRIDPQDGRVEIIEALGDDVSEVRESDDGSMLYFGVQSGPLMQLFGAPTTAPEQRSLLPLPLVEAFDLNGTRLAYSEPRTADIMLCELPAVRCEPAGLTGDRRRSGWALAADALWVALGDSMATELVRFDLASRSITIRVPHAPTAIGPNMAIAPDQMRAVVAREERPAIDLMLAPVK